MWLLLKLASWGKYYKGDFIAGGIAFLIPFFAGWATQGINNYPTILSLGGFIFSVLVVIIGNDYFTSKLSEGYISNRFSTPVSIGILDGYFTKAKDNKLPSQPSPRPEEWYDTFDSDNDFSVEWVPATEISRKYDIIINPYGETYPEIDKPNLTTLKRITKYIEEGGVFVNISGLAFYWLWDGERGDITGPPLLTHQMDSTGLLVPKEIQDQSNLLEAYLYKEFGIRTTLFDDKIVDVYSVKDTYFKELDKVGGDSQVHAFRPAFRSVKAACRLIPILKSDYLNSKIDDTFKSFECYPISVVKYGMGYLILNGMALESSRPQDFKKEIEAIKAICRKLKDKGSL